MLRRVLDRRLGRSWRFAAVIVQLWIAELHWNTRRSTSQCSARQ